MPTRKDIPAGAALLVAATIGATVLGALSTRPVGLGGDALDSFFNDWLYNAVFVTAALACFWRGVAVSRDRAAWVALGTSLALWGAGDIYWTAVVQFQHPEPYPSPADYLYIASYVPYYVGIMLFVRSRISHRPASMWLDGAIGGLAMAALAAAVLTPALAGLTEGSFTAVAVNVAYPLADLILFMLVVGAGFMMAGRGGREWALVAVGLLTLGVADSIYLYQVAVGSYETGNLLDALWLVNASALAIAAWSQPAETTPRRARAHSLVPVAGFAVLAVGILVYQLVDPVSEVAEGLAVAALGAGVLRLFLALGENSRLLKAVHEEAITDALTGLANRRALIDELERCLAGPAGSFAFALFDLDGFKTYNDRFGHVAGDALLARLGHNLADAVAAEGQAFRLGGDEFCILVPGTATATLDRASEALSEAGPGFEITNSYGTVELPREAADPSAAMKLADRRMYAQKRSRRRSVERQTRDVLLTAQVEREPQIGEHLRDVAYCAARVGQEVGVDGEELEVLRRAAELHDIGKIAIPEAIVEKDGPLDDDERRLIEQHTLIGERILAAAPAMAPVAQVVRSTHERWDGGGYPDGLAGEQIPFAARIIFICDAFDAMTSDRPYRSAISTEDALAEIRRHSGTQFDPGLVERFCAMIETPTWSTVAAADSHGNGVPASRRTASRSL
jgi:two-component system cell cycle response regulator